MTTVQGWDLSLNHAGLFELKNGKPSWFRYVTIQAGAANASKKHGVRLKLPKVKDRALFNVMRIAWWERYLWEVIEERKPDFVGIEDYALDQSMNAHDKGELGGLAKMLLWIHRVPFRLHEPGSIKMFAAHHGNCGKNQMEEAVRERWGFDFRKFNQPVRAESKKGQDTTVSEDLADAVAIAQIVWAEVQLRRGEIVMSDLEHEKEIQVFNRTTKAYPVNVLSREWIQKRDENEI